MIKNTTGTPSLEKIAPSFGHSFSLKKFEDSNPNSLPYWHFHPELEIVYIKHGSGKRHIGNHISYYSGGDLILLGPNLPHYGFTDRLTGSNSEIIVQMREDFLGKDFFHLPEMQSIMQLFERSKSGLSFSGNTKDEVGARINSLFYMDQVEKLTEFLKILQILSISKEYTTLNAVGITLVVQGQDTDRIDHIYKYVRQHFTEMIQLDDIAKEVSMTVPSFCRYFKKVTGKTFTAFVNEFRIVHACKLLSEERHSIAEVCFESGFNNFSHFNRLFKSITGKSPNVYRKSAEKVVYEEFYIG
ncbi:MAG: helix-turn-helix domain-containing protein [Saprospiraceae bacterium]|jgi:AraC-like DNA-binding protein|nr:helix-turn-helix domain-containing protein [Saprospiraceae bacterium]MBL0026728.1 helix-turn-helix domain-containing protein [Saprospiraceae bacterium]